MLTIRNKYSPFIVLIIMLYSFEISAQENSQEEENNNTFWDEFKSDLNSSGFDFEMGYKGDYFSNLSGGMGKNSVYLDNFDIIFNMNLEKIIGWKGATLTTYFLGNHGGEPADFTGAIQGISNIAAYNTWKLYEFRFEQLLLDGNLSLLAGLYDLNSEFDTREFSGIFINPSHGIGAEFSLTGQNGPSIFPNTSLAFRASYNFSTSWNLKAAVFDGVPGDLNYANGTSIRFDDNDGLLLVSEINFTNGSEKIKNDYFKYALGGWYYTSEFEMISETDIQSNPDIHKGNYGFYGSAEKLIFSENENSIEGLGAFLRFGWANNNVNIVNSYLGIGINYIGLFSGREDDILGFALAAAHNNEKYVNLLSEENIQIKDFEYIFELTYSLTISDWIQFQPDLQYVINPAYSYNNNHSFVLGCRLEISL